MATYTAMIEGTRHLELVAQSIGEDATDFGSSLDRDDWTQVLNDYRRLRDALKRVEKQIPAHWNIPADLRVR